MFTSTGTPIPVHALTESTWFSSTPTLSSAGVTRARNPSIQVFNQTLVLANGRAPAFVTFDFRAGARTSWSPRIPCINSFRAGARTSWSTRTPHICPGCACARTSWSPKSLNSVFTIRLPLLHPLSPPRFIAPCHLHGAPTLARFHCRFYLHHPSVLKIVKNHSRSPPHVSPHQSSLSAHVFRLLMQFASYMCSFSLDIEVEELEAGQFG